MSRHVLFCWELGGGTGHVSPYLPLLDELARRGWRVTIAARNSAEVADAILQRGFGLLQAPVCGHEFSGVEKNAYNYAEILLHFGYGHDTTLRGLLASWLTLLDLAQPDLVLASAAPTAQLAARVRALPHLMIGSGFNCPPPTDPLPLMRTWIPGVEQRLASAEATFTATTRAVLGRLKDAPEPAVSPQQLFATPTLLCTFAELDHYALRPDGARHLGVLTARRPETDAPAQCEVFGYLRSGPQTEPLLAALDKSGLDCLVYCPDASALLLKRWHRGGIRFADRPVEVGKVLPGCRFVVTYGSHHLTAEALLAGKPMLQLPVHLEQELTARRVVELGAGLTVADHERNAKFARLIAQLLHEPAYAEAAHGFADRYAGWQPGTAASAAAEACEALMHPIQNRHLKVASL